MSIGNSNIHQVSEIPEITKLPNGRLRVVRRFNKFTREDVDNANLGSLMGDFGDLDTTGQQIVNQGYTNLRLISVEVDNRFNAVTNNSNPVLVKTYETLTSQFIQITDEDKIEELENGTRRLTRVFRAVSGTSPETQGLGFNTHINSVVASDSYEYNLAKSDLNDTGAFAELTVTYITRDALLSVSEDNIGSQKAIVEQWFNPTDQYIDAFVIEGSDPKSSVDAIGFSGTYYLKDTQVMGKVQYAKSTPATYDSTISWNSYSNEWRISIFSTTIATSSVDSSYPPVNPSSWTMTTGYSMKTITRKNVSPAHIRESEKSGFDGSIQFDAHIRKTKTGYSLAKEDKSNVDGIPTEQYTFLKNNVTLSTSEDKVGSQLAIVKEVFNGTPSEPSGYVLASEEESNVDGIPTRRYRFLKSDVQLSLSVDNQSPLKTEVQEWFNPESDNDRDSKNNYSLINEQESNVGGIPTVRYTFAKDNVLLSVSEDKIGSQNAIVNEIFKPDNEASIPCKDVDGNTLDTHTEADRTESNHDGIKTVRVRFLKNNCILSTSEDLIGSQKAVIIEKFGDTAPAITDDDVNDINLTDDYIIANKQESSVDGIKTFRYTFLQEDVVLSKSVDNESPLLTEVLEVFNPASTRATKNNYVLTNKVESSVDGIPTERYTFKKTGVILSKSHELVGSQEAVVISKFGSAPTTSEANTFGGANYTIAKKEISGTTNQFTFTYTFLQSNVILSVSEDKVGSQKAIVNEIFNPTDTNTETDGLQITGKDAENANLDDTYSEVDRTISDFEGIKTVRVRFLKSGVTLLKTEDKVGSTLAIVEEVFDGTPSTPTDYSIAKEEESNVDGVSTKRYTFLKDDSLLSSVEDFESSLDTITEEWFNPAYNTSNPPFSTRRSKTGYVLIREGKSDIDGIPTERYTFAKPCIISVAQDFVEDINTIQVTAFSKTETSVKASLTEVTNNHKLISQRENNHDGIKTTTYTFEINTSDVVRYTANNRLQVVRTIYQTYNYDYNANYNVGSTSLTFQSTLLVLSDLRVNKRGNSGTFVKLEAVFTEPGESSRTETTGPTSMPGTEQITIISSGTTPVTLTETTDIKLINKQEQNNNGYTVFTRSYIKGIDATSPTTSYLNGRTYKIANNGNYSAVGGPSTGIIGDYFKATSSGTSLQAYLVGSITGTKLTYDNIITVNVPGTVKCKTVEATSTRISNLTTSASQVMLEVVPASTKKITIDVTESILTSIPSITQLAYNLDNINCSITKVNSGASTSTGGTITRQRGSLVTNATGFNRSVTFGSNNSYFPGCYLLNSTSSSTQTIVSGYLYRIMSAGSDYTDFGAPNNTVGTSFVADASGTLNTGTVKWFGTTGKFSYTSSRTPSVNNLGDAISTDGLSDQVTGLFPNGSTSQSNGNPPSSYITTGVIQQKARPVLTTIDGTTYYEVIKFSKN